MSALSSQKKATLRKSTSDAKSRRFTWRKFFKWISIIAFALIAIFACISLYVWFNRYALVENYAQSLLREQGIEAELSIKQLSREEAVIENVKLTYQTEAEPFFSARRIEANYILEEALEGRMKKLRLVEPTARLTFNEKFQIIDGWMPPRNQVGAGGISIPQDGVFIEDASFHLKTPFGAPVIGMTANIRDTEQFEATLILSPSELRYQSVAFEGSARIDLQVSGDEKDIEALFKIDDLKGQTSTGEAVSVTDATLDVNGLLTVDTSLPINLDTLDAIYKGNVEGTAQDILTPPGTLSDSQFIWRGDIIRNTAYPVRLGSDGQLDIKTNAFKFSDPVRARELAKTLTLSDAIGKTPIAQHFGPSVTKTIETLLRGPSFDTSVNVKFDHVIGEVSLLRALSVRQDAIRLNIQPFNDSPFYRWNRSEGALGLNFIADLNAPVPLKLNSTFIEASTLNGWRLNGITSFKSDLTTAAVWQTKSEGEVARLKPFNAKLDYTSREKRRDLHVIGNVDFQGRVPGGYVEGLETKGRVDMRLAPTGQTGLLLSYRSDNPEIKLESLITDTDWRLDDVTFKLDEGRDAFQLSKNKSFIKAQLSDAEFLLRHKTDSRELEMNAASAKIGGEIDLKSLIQDWSIDFTDAFIKSDTVPMEGTSMSIPKGQMQVEKRSDDIVFDFETPSLDIKIPQGQVSRLNVSAKGSPTRYTIVHSGGQFDLEATDIPNWPLTGEVAFIDNRFVGQAKVIIPKANNTPALIDYTYAEGGGEAVIKIESLIFAPGKLQPQNLFPSFAGKLARVDGGVSGDFNIIFSDNIIQSSNGVLMIENMSFGTAPGPITGLNTQIKFSSLLPLRTKGRQSLTMDLFDPGIPLENGTLEYDLLPEGILLHSAKWPIGSGNFELDPFTWNYGAEENRVVMRLKDIPLNEILDNYGEGKLQATGTLTGVFPIVVRGINVLVDKGYIEVPNGGIIRYSADEGDAVTYSQEQVLDIIRRQDTPKYRSLARDALREFSYRELRATVDGPLDGDVSLGIIFDGRNKKVLNGQPFEFDIDVQGELFNIMRSFNSNAQIKSQLLRNNLTAVE